MGYIIKMPNLQQQVEDFCQKHQLDTPLEFRMLDLISELGEVAKEILKTSNYGSRKFYLRPEFSDELGDVFFSLITVANQCNIDLEGVLHQAINKYEYRLRNTGNLGSKNSLEDSHVKTEE